MILKQNEFQTLAIYAFRYALGRKTYAVDDVSKLLLKHKKFIHEDGMQIIKRDIRRAIETNNYGMDMDKQVWSKVLEELS